MPKDWQASITNVQFLMHQDYGMEMTRPTLNFSSSRDEEQQQRHFDWIKWSSKEPHKKKKEGVFFWLSLVDQCCTHQYICTIGIKAFEKGCIKLYNMSGAMTSSCLKPRGSKDWMQINFVSSLAHWISLVCYVPSLLDLRLLQQPELVARGVGWRVPSE
jgi:hypothetical protein